MPHNDAVQRAVCRVKAAQRHARTRHARPMKKRARRARGEFGNVRFKACPPESVTYFPFGP
eukprot:3370103-Lingulodinium_polyedra.AAC.1